MCLGFLAGVNIEIQNINGGQRPIQGVDDLGTLYNQATSVKPTFDAMLHHVVSRVKGTEARCTGLKNLLRVSEKITLERSPSAASSSSTAAERLLRNNSLDDSADEFSVSGYGSPDRGISRIGFSIDESDSLASTTARVGSGLLRGDYSANQILDVTRGMILCDNVNVMNEVVQVLLSLDSRIEPWLHSQLNPETTFDTFGLGSVVTGSFQSNQQDLSMSELSVTTRDEHSLTDSMESIHQLSHHPRMHESLHRASSPIPAPAAGDDDTVLLSPSRPTRLIKSASLGLSTTFKPAAHEHGIRVLRVKARMGPPLDQTMLGDCLVNLTLQSDNNLHVCELQIVHTHTNTARVRLGGHDSYSWVRSTHKLLHLAKQKVDRLRAAGGTSQS